VCELKDERIEESMAYEINMLKPELRNATDCRVVILEYQSTKTISSKATLRKWTKEIFQDHDGAVAKSILEDIRCSDERGFLRLLFGRSRSCIHGRIQGSEDYPMVKLIPSGRDDDITKERFVKE